MATKRNETSETNQTPWILLIQHVTSNAARGDDVTIRASGLVPETSVASVVGGY